MTATVHFPALPGSTIDPPEIAPHEVQLWTARLDLTPARVRGFAAVLSRDERERAERFHASRHRRRFTVARGLTRALIGAHTASPPEAIVFRYGSQGKPAIEQPEGQLDFNVSHSSDQIVVALRHGRPVGVDIERLRPVREAGAIAAKHFSPEEIARLEALPARDFTTGFFNCWTRKEALIKAVGEGVFVAIDRFVVSLEPNDPARLLCLDGKAEDAADWSLFHLEPAAGVIGALAVGGQTPPAPRAWTIDPERQALPGID